MSDLSQPSAKKAIEHCTDVAEFLRILHGPNDVFEVRSLNCPDKIGGTFKATRSGYFSDADKASAAIASIEKLEPPAVYITVNPCKPALMARAANRVIDRAKSTTSDADIVRRRWLFIDIDAKRPSGVSSTEAELAGAVSVSDAIVGYLRSDGWPEPLEGMSGNGRYLLWRVDLPNDEQSTELMKSVLHALADRFDTDGAEVDCSTFNAARIVKILGTMARKGDELLGIDGVDDRPHRRSWSVRPETELKVVSVDMLQRLAEPARKIEENQPAENRSNLNRPSDVAVIERARKYLAKMDASVAGEKGHSSAYAATCALVQGFALSSEDALALLRSDYNPRCNPPWSDKELRHKVESANKASGDRGYLLNKTQTESRSTTIIEAGKQTPWEPKLLRMADVESRPVNWFWKNRIAAGRLSLLVGMPGCGKSFLTCDMASRVSTGTPCPTVRHVDAVRYCSSRLRMIQAIRFGLGWMLILRT